VQETDMFAPVRGAHIVLCDRDGSRANMTASWLSQMAWSVSVLDDAVVADFSQAGTASVVTAPLPFVHSSRWVAPQDLQSHVDAGAIILDFATEREYRNGHIPGAWYAQRSNAAEVLRTAHQATSFILTSPDGLKALYALKELSENTAKPIYLLTGGTVAWQNASFSLESAQLRFACSPTDRYRRPYEGTNATAATMQAYLDWEYGLVAQLDRDRTHGFSILA
jgi:rhodanese-related sulfurtransferase